MDFRASRFAEAQRVRLRSEAGLQSPPNRSAVDRQMSVNHEAAFWRDHRFFASGRDLTTANLLLAEQVARVWDCVQGSVQLSRDAHHFAPEMI